jgi:hypothetical protein
MPYVDAAGLKPKFEEAGRGYPIVFLHEFRSHLRACGDQVRCSSRARVGIVCDARGYLLGDASEDAALDPNTEFSVASESVTAEPLRMGGTQQ